MAHVFRCAIWAAVSTPEQADDDKGSLAAQIATARDLIARRGWQESALFTVPGQSRSITFLADAMAQIPAMDAMIKAARRAEFDLLVAYSYDRLARTQSLLAQIRDYLRLCNVQVYISTMPIEPVLPGELDQSDDGAEALVGSVGGYTAREEIKRFVRRSRMGKARKVERGLWIGGIPPYGYTYQARGTLQIEPGEAAILRRIVGMYQAGDGAVPIARRLNDEGIPTRKGKKWKGSTINSMLRNPAIAGQVAFGRHASSRRVDPTTGEIAKTVKHQAPAVAAAGQHEAILTGDEWKALQAEITRRRRMGGRAVTSSGDNVHILSGLIRCAHCGGAMWTHSASPPRGDSKGQRYWYYHCGTYRSGAGCKVNSILMADAEATVLGELQRYATDPGAIELAVQSPEVNGAGAEIAICEKAVRELPSKRKRWDDAYESGNLDLPTYTARVQGLQDQERALRGRLEALRATVHRADTIEHQRERLQALAQVPLSSLPRPALKALLRELVERVTITDGRVSETRLREV